MKLTDDERAGLSKEEIEAIEAEMSEDEARAGGKAPVDDDASGKDDDAEDKATADAKAAPAKDAKNAKDAKPGDADTDDGKADDADNADGDANDAAAPESGDKSPFAVPFQHTPTIKSEEVQARFDQLKASLDVLDTKFDAGEIDRKVYNAERDKVYAERERISAAVLEDRIATRISERSQEQTAKALWDSNVESFLDENPAYKADETLYDALDARVKRLAADPKNVELTDRQLLKMADEQIRSRFKVGEDKGDKGAADTKPDPKKVVAEKRKPDKSDVPPTLGSVPAAAGNEAADDEFASLDKLANTDSVAYERALAKLSSEQQDRYLRGATV